MNKPTPKTIMSYDMGEVGKWIDHIYGYQEGYTSGVLFNLLCEGNEDCIFDLSAEYNTAGDSKKPTSDEFLVLSLIEKEFPDLRNGDVLLSYDCFRIAFGGYG